MSAVELIQLVMGSGILAGGGGMMRWALMMERRVMALEVKGGIAR